MRNTEDFGTYFYRKINRKQIYGVRIKVESAKPREHDRNVSDVRV